VTTRHGFGTKHFNAEPTRRIFEAKRFIFPSYCVAFPLTRIDAGPKRDAVSTKRVESNPKPFDARSFSGQITPACFENGQCG
jgi:hypothetical protein